MQKYKARKEVVEQVTSKLQASKNVFSRGDFDEYKITDEELMEHCEDIEKSHLYLSKKWMNGKWIYEYPEDKYGIKVKEIKHGLIDENGKKLDFKLDINKYKLLEYYIDGSHDYLFINKTDENDIIPAWKELKINHSEYEERTNFRKEFSENIKKYRNTDFKNKGISFRFSQKSINKLSCDKAINKSKLNGFSVAEHFEAINHIKELVENVDNFVKYEDRKNKDNVIAIYRGNIPIKLSTRNSYAYITIKELKITGRLVYSLELMLKKYPSLKNEGLGQRLNKAIQSQPDCNPLPLKIIPNSQNMSSKIKPDYDGHNVLHKSFDITVTDITENNKQKKLEQLEKSLNAMYTNTPFVIKHIKADKESKNYGNITLRISNFDKNKIEKAVHSLALTLDTKVGAAKGEAFTFKAQEELTNRFVNELTEKTKAVYNFVISYFGLPEITVVSKANLTYKGKIIYNSETGEPIQEKDWKKFVEVLEQFLNRNYNGVGERIVLSSEALGRILARLSETNSLEKIKKKTLSELSINHRNFDWISQSSKNMADVLDGSVDRWQAARIEMATHSAAIKVTKVTDNMRNDIQDIIINGIINRQSKAQVSQNLFDKCVGLNRDFQRIADTEIQNNTNNAYLKEEVYNTKEGEKVYFKRYEMLDDNTCKKCKKIKGEIALWSDIALPDEHIKDEYAKYAIWEGKESGDMPAGILHPYCRGSWFRYYPELD